MAPKRKQTNPKESAAPAATVAERAVRRSPRLINAAERAVRRSPRLINAATAAPAAGPEPPKRKKVKTQTKTKTETNSAVKKKGKAKAPPSPAVDDSKIIVIEHCKQCRSFKTQANQVKEALERDVAGVNVVVNPEKPRRGCFEIREEGGEIFVSLLDMKRPFPPLKALDMEKLIADIVEKIR